MSEIISQYTRQNAIDDGVLIELSKEWCRRASIAVSTAVTTAVWYDVLGWESEKVDPTNHEATERTGSMLYHMSVQIFKNLHKETAPLEWIINGHHLIAHFVDEPGAGLGITITLADED